MAELLDEEVNKIMWSIPNVLCLVGSRSGDEWNGMTQSWVTQVSMEPVLIAIAVDNTALTHRLITESGVFSVNLWDREDTKTFVKFSKPASYENGTLNGRAVREGETGAPVFEEAVAFVECRVLDQKDVGTHTVFYGEVVVAGFQGRGEEAEIARIEDTRMKYGGVKRH
ncbi:MAG: flavin reductase family protein [Acidimicrobiia bacterium]|nr:flavin reductase family protein [Acidimicrobiia bacterium]